jgi:hypothetical protein
MSEPNLLSNGRFLENLDDWTASAGAVFSVGDGDDHYGVAVLPAGDYIEQEFSVDRARSFSLHLALKSTEALTAGKVTAVLSDDSGNVLTTLQPTAPVVSTWTETTYTVGLVPGPTYTLRIANAGAAADVKVDDCSEKVAEEAAVPGPTYTLRIANAGAAADVKVDDCSEKVAEEAAVPGPTYTLRIANAGAAADVKVDDVWLWFCPITRATLAAQVHAKLGRLATNRSLSTTPSGALTEGDYTYAVDAGLRLVGAINDETGLPDVRYLDAGDVDAALDAVEAQMMDRLYCDYSADVDIRVGPRSENLSQTADAINKVRGGSGAGSTGGRIVMRKLRHSAIEDSDD